MVGALGKASRPERVKYNANEYYNANEADRYTGTSNIIQKEMTYKALELLGVKKGEFHLVADIGCGSGLSSRILSLEGYPWVGIDVSLDMLALAQTQDQEENNKTGLQKVGSNNKNAFRISQASLCQGHLTASDMSQGLPFRTEAFDFAISISAVQWLCYTKTFPPRQAAQRFFDSVWRCLRTSESRAAFQVYLENDDHMNLLVDAATSAGFLATYCMDYPHPTTAKKFYLMLAKPYKAKSKPAHEEEEEERQKSARAATKQSFSRCCNLAWPATASCSLPWLTWRKGNDPCAARTSASRVVQEHAHTGKRILRLLRHASSYVGTLSPPSILSTSPNGPFFGHVDSSRAEEENSRVEISVPHKGFMPCGGPFMLQLQVNHKNLLNENEIRVLESKKRKEREKGKEKVKEDAGGNEVENILLSSEIEEAVQGAFQNKNGVDNNNERSLSSVLATLVQRLLGCSDAEMSEISMSYPKTTNNNKNSNETHQKGQKPEKEKEKTKKVESIGGSWPRYLQQAQQQKHNTNSQTLSSSSSNNSKKAFFYLEHVTGEEDSVQGNSCTSSKNIAILHATKPPLPEILVVASDTYGIDIHRGGGSGCDDGDSLQNAHRQLIALCENRNASVIGVDMLVHSLENVSCAWLVYVPGLQTIERKAVWEQWSQWHCHQWQQQ